MFYTSWQITRIVIEKFKIQSNINFRIVKIDDITYKKLFKNSNMLILYLWNIMYLQGIMLKIPIMSL